MVRVSSRACPLIRDGSHAKSWASHSSPRRPAPSSANRRLRGIAQDDSDLVISRDYIGHGLRSRAHDLPSIELGPKPEHEIRLALAREVDTERWTRLDRADPGGRSSGCTTN